MSLYIKPEETSNKLPHPREFQTEFVVYIGHIKERKVVSIAFNANKMKTVLYTKKN